VAAWEGRRVGRALALAGAAGPGRHGPPDRRAARRPGPGHQSHLEGRPASAFPPARWPLGDRDRADRGQRGPAGGAALRRKAEARPGVCGYSPQAGSGRLGARERGAGSVDRYRRPLAREPAHRPSLGGLPLGAGRGAGAAVPGRVPAGVCYPCGGRPTGPAAARAGPGAPSLWGDAHPGADPRLAAAPLAPGRGAARPRRPVAPDPRCR
jgi:hypothetical protein